MKSTDRLLLHSLDSATPGGIERRRFLDVLVRFVVVTCAFAVVFLAGYVLGSLP